MSTIFVICKNDFPEHALFGTEQQAEAKRVELEFRDFRSKGNTCTFWPTYKARIFWHIKPVPLTDMSTGLTP